MTSSFSLLLLQLCNQFIAETGEGGAGNVYLLIWLNGIFSKSLPGRQFPPLGGTKVSDTFSPVAFPPSCFYPSVLRDLGRYAVHVEKTFNWCQVAMLRKPSSVIPQLLILEGWPKIFPLWSLCLKQDLVTPSWPQIQSPSDLASRMQELQASTIPRVFSTLTAAPCLWTPSSDGITD